MNKYAIYYQNGDIQIVDAESEEDAMNKATCAIAHVELASKELIERYGLD